MPLIKPLLKSQIIEHINNLTNDNGKSNIQRKSDFMNKFHKYAKNIFPINSMGDASRLSGLAAFTGDKSEVTYSYNLALSKALGAYAKVASVGMIPGLYLPAYIPIDMVLYPETLKATNDKDKSTQADILANAIDKWLKTGISNYTVPAAPPVPTPWK